MEIAAKTTVPEDAEMVSDDTADAEIGVVDAKPVAARALMVVVTTTIATIMESPATKTWDYTTGHMEIYPMNPINATLPPTDKKPEQRSQT